ncbi:MAG: hypothetical protein UT32_C0009G0072 [Parcubacteria group bacterium GW2011_GWC2_39_14]|nr:MAG: hypothetical protein UT32_C0009G0072 [Parcubacteria group bacterium GW2011_GWC2_39_14]KKR55409.1 MAG: hypothetical protein UT91_C0002G0070 [Parcubacteria group bacterium GW2011_GWA2_40_23]
MLCSKKKITVVKGKIELLLDENMDFLSYFSFGEIMRETGEDDFVEHKDVICISIESVNSDSFDSKHCQGTRFARNYSGEANTTSFSKKFLHLNFGLKIKKNSDKNYVFFVTKNYLRFIKYKIENIYPLGIHLFDVLQIETIKLGNIAIYGSAFLNSKSKEASLIVAPPGVGKTYTLLNLAKQENVEIISEETSYVNMVNNAGSLIPTQNTFLNDRKNKGSAMNLISFLFARKIKKRLEGTLKQINFATSETVLKRIYILENSKNDLIKRLEHSEENFKRLLTIQRFTSSYFNNQLLRAFSRFSELNLEQILQREEAILRNLYTNVELYSVCASRVEKFPELIRQIDAQT